MIIKIYSLLIKLFSIKLLDIYDANFLWKNDLVFDNKNIIKFFKENNIINNNLSNFQYIDLNKIFNLLIKNNSIKKISTFFKENKRLKSKFDANGVDKFANKKNMLKDFNVQIKYSFE